MEPLERLLNLVGLLLETSTPLTFEQIRETLDAYRADKVDSAKRMFGTEQGYIIPKDEYYLPEIAFTPEELGALLVAAQSGGENTRAEQAARKLLYGADGGVLAGLAGGPLASGSDARSALVIDCADAAQRRRKVRFGYRTSQGQAGERQVDAFAMVFRGGHWYLVGHDGDRDDVRAFRLSRFTGDVEDVGDGGEPPGGFRAADHVQAGAWAAAAEEHATIAFSPGVAWWAEGSFAGARRVGDDDDGWVVVDVPMADPGLLASLVLQFGPEAVVRTPDVLRDEIVRRLEAAGA
jgi:proteasome accessory factor B